MLGNASGTAHAAVLNDGAGPNNSQLLSRNPISHTAGSGSIKTSKSSSTNGGTAAATAFVGGRKFDPEAFSPAQPPAAIRATLTQDPSENSEAVSDRHKRRKPAPKQMTFQEQRRNKHGKVLRNVLLVKMSQNMAAPNTQRDVGLPTVIHVQQYMAIGIINRSLQSVRLVVCLYSLGQYLIRPTSCIRQGHRVE